jgi:ABC-type sulfate transport system permease component
MTREAGEDEEKGFLFDRGSRLGAVQAGKNSEVKGNISMQKFKLVLCLLAVLVVSLSSALADGSGYTPVFADPTTITSAATTAFTAIATFMVGVLGFWVIFRLVKKIRG